VTTFCALALAVVTSAATAPTVPTHQCSDPCLQDARSTAKECASSATGAFQDTLDGCLERDHECVDACRAVQQGCRDDTSVGVDYVACDLELTAAKVQCGNSFPSGSLRQNACLFRAQAANNRCRRVARRHARHELRQCRAAFRECAHGCGPGGPPGGSDSCTAEAKGAVQSLLNGCRKAYQATASACIDKDLTCTQTCIDARATCTAPTQATLDAAIASCNSQAAAAVAACQSANPGGGTAFDDCVEAAQANATTCRDAALQAAAPGLAACVGPYLACVHACPPGTT
jgi:ribosomal protein S14